MFAKITFRDSVVILQPIRPYLITKIYSIVAFSSSSVIFLPLDVEVPPHYAATDSATLTGQLVLQNISLESLHV